MFSKVLIANRGEIAVRIIRACRELGITSVAIYSDIDRRALHVRLADQAIHLGPSEPDQSYLSFEKIIQAARTTGSQAIHPGYGFLAENSAFARAVQEAGLVFIGPSPTAIQLMGDKGEARSLLAAAGIPILPGYQGIDDDQTLIHFAKKIGYPLLVKASAGGGGKGLRLVNGSHELYEAIAAARREARHAFDDQRLILERYITNAHHVEFQVLGDQDGNLLHLYERECSVQRRHQKIIEETPAPLMTGDLRDRMGAAAVSAAKAVGYYNAGTVEFIVDPTTQEFYFLEMNTRLQVEHPVTELVSGLDLVQWQMRIASGEKLPFNQDQIIQRGHALECRLYAEDPAAGFLPMTGDIYRFLEPRGPAVRVDTGVTSGDTISIHYDPLIAKVITHAEERVGAIRKMQAALQEMVVLGVQTNWQFLQDVLAHPDFQAGKVHTTWIEENFEGWQPPDCPLPPEVLVAAALTEFQSVSGSQAPPGIASLDPYNPWRVPNGYRSGEAA